MQAILTPDQMRTLESTAFSQGVSTLLLMEEAARGAHDALADILQGVKGRDLLYLIGSGNNGGDGLAMARLCKQDGGHPRILLVGEPKTPDAKTNLRYAQALGLPMMRYTEDQDVTVFRRPDAVVDAIFGIGFHGSLPAGLYPLVQVVKAWQVPVMALDVPSGLNGESGQVVGEAFQASRTLAIGHLKTGLCLCRTEQVGEMRVIPLHLPKAAYPDPCHSGWITALEEKDLPLLLPRRPRNAHKGSAGRVLLYMGSLGMAGAAGMAAQAAEACLRGGAGLVTLACEPEIIPILQTLAPNAMCLPVQEAIKHPPAHDVLALGCGLGQSEEVWENILALWNKDKPSVWDADALNLLALHPMNLGEKAVMTPHPGEAARLLQCEINEVLTQPLEAAKQLQDKYGGTIILKGATSVIQDSRRTALNLVGSPALAKGGSGDALAGIIAALLADSMGDAPFEAARTACLWHGMAGKEAAKGMNERSVLTSDVIACLGLVLRNDRTSSAHQA